MEIKCSLVYQTYAELSSGFLRLLRGSIPLPTAYVVLLMYKVNLISLILQGSSAYHSQKRE